MFGDYCYPHLSSPVTDQKRENKSRDLGGGGYLQLQRLRAPRVADRSPVLHTPPHEPIPKHSLKSYLYADSTAACSSSWMNPQTRPSSCLANVSMQTPTAHFILTFSNLNFQFFCIQAHGTVFLCSADSIPALSSGCPNRS